MTKLVPFGMSQRPDFSNCLPVHRSRIRYSGGWFGVDRQKQTLDAANIKRLVASPWSVFSARMQIRVSVDTIINYVIFTGDVANLPPAIEW